MPKRHLLQLSVALWVILAICATTTGCHSCCKSCCCCPPNGDFPRELNKVTQPTYVIEPPDILQIDALNLVPVPPYRISPLDLLLVQSGDLLPSMAPLTGAYTVEPEGTLNLGVDFGTVQVAGQTLEEATKTVEALIQKRVPKGHASVTLAQMRRQQQIAGEHLVAQDGTINLGNYGQVRVVGLTLEQARAVIQEHLTKFFVKPEISMVVSGYNSKVYYVVFDGAGYGQSLIRVPITGNETVLDALADLRGFPAQTSLCKVWVVRPTPAGAHCDQVLPVNWKAIVDCGETATNYQLLPGDRIHVGPDTLICTSNWLAKAFAPVEQTFGFILFGTSVVRELHPSGGTGGTGTGTGGLGF
ncbi:MAG TPA: polysaccharide biosynthesis/export family protein [Gemmataceae bacterium]|nr:polysaccharide biosynthesis/export family protein [Gemmataceae bacterium]